jgi:hypothetical protein
MHAISRAALARVLIVTGLAAAPRTLAAQGADTTRPAPPRPWYQRLSLRGYTQVRYNRLLESNPDLVCQQCDRSIGRNGGFSIRRARIVVSGDLTDRVSVYIQPDLATEVSGTQHLAQIRDLYADLWLDSAKTFRLRVGQSKVPFGFENIQSSSNRIPLDRADPTNSALPNERDIGVFAYWTPAVAKQRFRILTDSGLKGSGDYGVFGVGAFNGQTANRPELNNSLHAVARLAYPFRLANGQFVELGVQGYTGRFVVPTSQRSASTVLGALEQRDQRVAGTFVLYPQPFGLQAEWNVGEGPEIDPAARLIDERDLNGGYVQAMWRARFGRQVLIPYARAQRYDGGKKLETDARSHRVRELEVGAEWLPFSALELTAAMTFADRRAEDAATPSNRQKGRFLRLQAQVNY